ncbi:hypothetical protein GCM10020001_115070 [Nonomuraea salmonea]
MERRLLTAKLGRLLDERAQRFSREWMDIAAKTVVPIPGTVRGDGSLPHRVCSAAGRLGATYAWGAPIVGSRVIDGLLFRVEMTPDVLSVKIPEHHEGIVLAMPDMDNAILSTAGGYSLVAGSHAFVRACLDCGIDEARVRFLRYARRLADANPSVMAVAMEHPPRWRSWRSPREVHPESNTAQQLHLMESFVERTLPASRFVLSWLSERSQALDDGERLHAQFEELMNEVFYALDDYPSDPDLREEGDISEQELRERVNETLRRLAALG